MELKIYEQLNFVSNLDDMYKQTILRYTSSSNEINGQLRDDTTLSKIIWLDVTSFDQMFEMVPPINEDIFVYRGINTSQNELVKIQNKGYISTTYDINIAKHFSGSNCILKIRIPRGSKILPIEKISFYPTEKEILLPRNSYLLVGNEEYDYVNCLFVKKKDKERNIQYNIFEEKIYEQISTFVVDKIDFEHLENKNSYQKIVRIIEENHIGYEIFPEVIDYIIGVLNRISEAKMGLVYHFAMFFTKMSLNEFKFFSENKIMENIDDFPNELNQNELNIVINMSINPIKIEFVDQFFRILMKESYNETKTIPEYDFDSIMYEYFNNFLNDEIIKNRLKYILRSIAYIKKLMKKIKPFYIYDKIYFLKESGKLDLLNVLNQDHWLLSYYQSIVK